MKKYHSILNAVILAGIGAGMTLTGAALKFILSRIRRAIPDKKH